MSTRFTLAVLAFVMAGASPVLVAAQPRPAAPPAVAKAPAARAPAAAPAPAADQAAAFKHVEFLTRKALEQLELLEFDAAKKALGDAEALCEKHRLAAYAACARVSMIQGVLAITAYKDRFNGRKGFVKALTVDPSQRIDAALSTPEAEEIFASAKKEAEAVRKAAPPPPLPPPPVAAPPREPEGEGEGEGEAEEREVDPRDVRGILHNAVSEAPQSTPVRIKCVVGPDVAVSKVFVFYRAKGRDDWTPEIMSQARGAYVATIPATMVKPPAVDYYIEVRDGRGRAQIASGNVISPHQIRVVLPRARGARPEAVVARRPLVEDELDEAARVKRKRREAGAKMPMWARLGVGTGFGWIGKGAKPDAGSSAGALEGGGFASAPLHVAPELGINLTGNFALSVAGRVQVLTMADKGESLTGAGLVRGYWMFGSEKLRPFANLAIGGGYIIHTTEVRPSGGTLKANSFMAGPFLAGLGGGVSYALSPRVLILGEVQAMIGVPTNFTFNVDVNLGVGFVF
ncbi:MAG: hypothetical protein HY906_24425 [Deltaproteobacteria bacterium]|nr:hypothetical protein [Deltaproteobacteria bacterium]